jgi:hypothetical protein
MSRSKSDLLSIEVTAGRLTNASCNIVKENNWLGTSEMVNRRYAINNLTLPPSAAQFVFAGQVPSHTVHAAFTAQLQLCPVYSATRNVAHCRNNSIFEICV